MCALHAALPIPFGGHPSTFVVCTSKKLMPYKTAAVEATNELLVVTECVSCYLYIDGVQFVVGTSDHIVSLVIRSTTMIMHQFLWLFWHKNLNHTTSTVTMHHSNIKVWLA